ncbi:MAG: hypothetical protein ACYC06_06585 [Ilumatobacteraceae bacterium]
MPTARKSLKQVIADLEERNSLTKQDADALRSAPRWSLTGAELTGYLGVGIIGVGITWTVIAVIQDLSQLTVYFAMYVGGAVALAAARWLRPRGIRSGQVAEVLFGIGVGLLAGAIGLTLNDLGLRDSIAAAVASALAVIVGLATCRRTLFVGTLIVVAAAQPLIGSISGSFHLSESVLPLVIVLSGALLAFLGLQRVGSPLIARLAGSASIVIGSFAFAVTQDGSFRPILSIAICATLFYIGARRIDLEFIIGGGTGITIAIAILTERIFDAFVMQGAVVTATGIAISTLSLVIIRRRDTSSS